jgi:hypothetical protein
MEEMPRPRIGRCFEGVSMPGKFRVTGCWMSIILSIVLTVLLNLMLRGCNAGW